MSEHQLRKEPALPGTGLHRLGNLLWHLLVLGVVLLAIYVSAGRYAMGNIGALREDLLLELNARLPFGIEVGRLAGGWSAFSPEFAFDELLITQLDSEAAPVRVVRGRLRLDVPGSLSAGSLQLSQLELVGLSLRARLTADGNIEVEGFESDGSGALQSWLAEFLPRVGGVSLLDSTLTLASAGTERELRADLSLTRDGNERLLQGRLEGRDLRLSVHAGGVGNPLRPLTWSGDVYLDVASDDLAGLSTLWSSLDWPFTLAGSAEAEFWLSRASGDSQARLRLNGAAVRVEERGGAWSLPLDALAFKAALSQQQNHWTLLAQDLHAERDGSVLDLSRAQFDWWGSALRVRASELGLAGLPTLLAAAPGIPTGLRDVLPDLAPGGRLVGLELRLDDLAKPADSWSLRGLLDGVSVESWRGAPALSGVSGYLALAPGGGQLQVDATPFSMHFPKVYSDAMRYTEVWGDIGLHWDAAGLRIDSGLVRTRGDEGEAHVLFAVEIPFEESVAGPEMGLLVGLQNSRAVYRQKYLPFVLPEGLLNWLDGSVEEATVEQAGFLWRGSLRRNNSKHRTVQLFVDIDDGRLRFDPDWPVLTDLSATIRVDNGLTWAWARRGQIYAMPLEGLAIRLNAAQGRAQLSLRSLIHGNAGSGQRLLVETPLAELTRNAFADWTMSGPVEGELALELALTKERETPAIDLSLALDGVQTSMTALALPVADIRGTLRYQTGNGFTGSSLQGTLWGEPLAASVNEALNTGGAEDKRAEILRVDLKGRLNGGELSTWLGQPLLGFIDGVTAVEGALRLQPGEPPVLDLKSDLDGVSLDAPRPYNKAGDMSLPLALEVSFDAEPVLALSLGERLRLQLAFDQGELAQAIVAVGGQKNTAACDVRLCLSGSLSELDLTAWRSFANRYLWGGATNENGSVNESAVPLSDDLDYRIDSLSVGDMRAAERRFGAARVDLWGRGDLWQGSIESSWVQGSLSREDGGLQLLIEYFDLQQLDGGESLSLPELRALLPSMRVDILDLRSAEQSLGSLGFNVDSERTDGGLYLSAIEGQLWGMDLSAGQPGLVAWTPKGSDEDTAVEFDLGFGDIGDSLADLGYERTLESRRGSAAVRLNWPGSPTDFAAVAATGSLQLTLRDGRLLETRPGALSMVSFFNFAGILQRLSLSHMFESGIPYVEASADLRFGNATLRIEDLQIDGPASAFVFSGQRDLVSGDIDGELTVTLPVANNLPWVAALAGGPVVAAGVFVVSRVFEKQFDRMSSAVYDVSGGIDDPQVTFRQLFDTRSQAASDLNLPEVP